MQLAQQILKDHMARIFESLPMLDGFYVQQDLSIDELSLHSWPGLDRSGFVAEELGRTLEDLVDEHPDVAERLRGRTFARSFQ